MITVNLIILIAFQHPHMEGISTRPSSVYSLVSTKQGKYPYTLMVPRDGGLYKNVFIKNNQQISEWRVRWNPYDVTQQAQGWY